MGWFWQFNRKQGYKAGSPSSPTPAWTITSINENYDWTTSEDPCTRELGSGWRIPNDAEWTNTFSVGRGYVNLYPSVLIMHAPGVLASGSGSWNNGGSPGLPKGFYAISKQNTSDNSKAYTMFFYYDWGYLDNAYPKAQGFSVRCIRD